MARSIYLARHGETEWNRVGRWQGHTDIALSDVGREQARLLAERVKAFGIRAVFASDLKRARETAEIVARARGLAPPAIDARLRERGFGCFEGLTREECAERFPDAWQQYQFDRRSTPPGSEPQESVVTRMRGALTEIAEDVGEGDVLVVSHGGALRAFVHATTGNTPPPLTNGALLRAAYQNGVFLGVADLSESTPPSNL